MLLDLAGRRRSRCRVRAARVELGSTAYLFPLRVLLCWVPMSAGAQLLGTGIPAAPTTRARTAAIERAARWIARGRRLEMQGLADELGVSRVTLFRNVGTREDLLGEALWLLTEQTLLLAARRWERERGADELYSVGTGRQINALVAGSGALHTLLGDEPALTIRVLTDPRGRVQTGVVAFVEQTLRRDMREHGFVPITAPGDLAFALVRIGESFLYADVLASRPPDIEAANHIQRALIEATTARTIGRERLTR